MRRISDHLRSFLFLAILLLVARNLWSSSPRILSHLFHRSCYLSAVLSAASESYNIVGSSRDRDAGH